jgi:hypothetical protein
MSQRPKRADTLLAAVLRFVAAHPADPKGRRSYGKSSEPGALAFDTLALEVARFQLEQVGPYRRLATARGVTASSLHHWRNAPAAPSSAFKRVVLASSDARVIFRSSGTTQSERRSEHHHPYPELYRSIIDASFSRWCLTPELVADPSALSLVPPLELAPDSSLGFMIDQVLAKLGGDQCLAVDHRGLDTQRALAWLDERCAAGRPVLVLATALALHALLAAAAEIGRSKRLASGSVVFETGGFKGRQVTITRDELVQACGRWLGVPAARVVREYGMTELTSQCYSATLLGDDPDLLFSPPWMRVRFLDPLSLREVPPGEPGLIAFFDLGNLGSLSHVLTEDIGAADPAGGFRLLGRADGAELRGCSLVAEELGAFQEARDWR